MSDNFAKFVFLGAMIFVVLAANREVVYENKNDSPKKQLASYLGTNEPPKFILEPPEDVMPQVNSATTPLVAIPVTAAPIAAEQPKTQAGMANPARYEEPSHGANALVAQSVNTIGNENMNAESSVTQQPFSRYGEEPPPRLDAPIALVGDLITGEVIFGVAEKQRWPIASITKLFSAVLASRTLRMHGSTTFAADNFPPESLPNGFKEGDKYSVRDLMSAMLIKSSNEAAEALSGIWGRDNFISGINSIAAEWGLQETHFDDPTGLSVANQSTAEDLFKLAKNIYERHPQIFNTTKEKSATITELNSGKSIIITNINVFAGRVDFLGGKTGYTDEAGGNLLSVFSYENRPVATIVLGSENRFAETEALFDWFKKNYR